MAKLNVKAVAEMKEVFEKSQYIKRVWETDENLIIPLDTYAELINPTMKQIASNPVIIAKERKNGGQFLKMWLPLEGESGIEYDLSYEHSFEEGDEISKDSLHFCVERCMNKKHGYVTGKVVG